MKRSRPKAIAALLWGITGAASVWAAAGKSAALHDPVALPGQIIVDPANPAWLRYNGGGPVFIAGIGEPENFLYRGTRNPDGTRSGDQMKLITRVAGTGVNCVYVIGFVDSRYGGDGTPAKDNFGNPFENGDINREINPDILNQWEEWFNALENHGIIIYFVLYDDLIDVLPNQRMNWDLDAQGNLHPQEKKYVDAVVNKFKHHKRLIWCVNESANKSYPGTYVARWKKIAERIRELDTYKHPIAMGMVVPTDPDRVAEASQQAYAGHPCFNQDLVQHVQAQNADAMHKIFLDFWGQAQGRYNLLLAQSWPVTHGADQRQKSWAVAMAGAYFMHAMPTSNKTQVYDMERTPVEEFQTMGHVARFMESVAELTRMAPRDDLRNGQTQWVLAAPDSGAYVAYSYNATENLGLKGVKEGDYRLRWMDCVSGATREESGIVAIGGDMVWFKPKGFGNEVALYVSAAKAAQKPQPAAKKKSEKSPQPQKAAKSATVERWDTWEWALESGRDYGNPFREVTLRATFTCPAAKKEITVHGFYDGGRTWRIRFMPTEVGSWTYRTESNDPDLNGQSGRLFCVAASKPYLHGPLRASGFHFEHANGKRRFLISTRLSAMYATPEARTATIAYLKESGINRLLFMMGGIQDTIKNLYGPNLDFTRYDVEKFRQIDAWIDELRRNDILAAPYFYYFNDGDQCKMTREDDFAYIQYGMARFGAYANVLPCLANEVEKKYTRFADPAYNLKSHEWANEMGAFLKKCAVFGQAVTVHNPMETDNAVRPSFYTLLADWPFPWADYMMRQAQVGAMGSVPEMSDHVPESKIPLYNERAFARHNQLLIDLRRFGIPIINEEPGYEMAGRDWKGRVTPQPRPWHSQTPDTVRPTFWTAATAGAYCMWGNMATYELYDPLPTLRAAASPTPTYLKVLASVMAELPYWEMSPANDCVNANAVEIEGVKYRTHFALAKPTDSYLIYSLKGGPMEVKLPQGRYEATLIDPRTGNRKDLGRISGTVFKTDLPAGSDAVVIIKKV
ncbi:MAG: DUF5060 domain-containing protein [Candidatus Sumerlaeia bacterium]|nr:DUF5060 domain-containing protein [Candidatus Sumerlaeia bacterium]